MKCQMKPSYFYFIICENLYIINILFHLLKCQKFSNVNFFLAKAATFVTFIDWLQSLKAYILWYMESLVNLLIMDNFSISQT